MNQYRIRGGGISGLTAAYCLAASGKHVTVFEKDQKIGYSRHGDFEGLENWIFPDSLDVFHLSGLDKSKLDHWPVYDFTVNCPPDNPFGIRSVSPFFSIVSRGPNHGSIDKWLYDSCLDKGVRFQFGESLSENNSDILASGSNRAVAFIQGGIFHTRRPDQVHLLLGNRYAPKGYAYLIIRNGLGTVATAFKKPLNKDIQPFQNSLSYFRSVGFSITLHQKFGSRGSFKLPTLNPFIRPIKIGEAGGFQDFLFGFGMKPAMISGVMAARFLTGDETGAKKLNRVLKRKMRLSFVNRMLYERISDPLKRELACRLAGSPNPVEILGEAYKWNMKRALHWLKAARSLEIRFS